MGKSSPLPGVLKGLCRCGSGAHLVFLPKGLSSGRQAFQVSHSQAEACPVFPNIHWASKVWLGEIFEILLSFALVLSIVTAANVLHPYHWQRALEQDAPGLRVGGVLGPLVREWPSVGSFFEHDQVQRMRMGLPSVTCYLTGGFWTSERPFSSRHEPSPGWWTGYSPPARIPRWLRPWWMTSPGSATSSCAQ